MKLINLFVAILLGSFLLLGCETSTEPEEPEAVYPAYIDSNSNGVNDYVEEGTHQSGPTNTSSVATRSSVEARGPGHSFVDENNDGICDYAQDGSSTWHGPGFIDNNNNGVSDYWDESHPMHQRHEGMRFHDENENHINDYMEEQTHWGEHEFIDENQDGICDRAQDGSPTWHGPGFEDSNNNGMSDHWEEGGRGHGGMTGGHH
jgi:hypothetical protein